MYVRLGDSVCAVDMKLCVFVCVRMFTYMHTVFIFYIPFMYFYSFVLRTLNAFNNMNENYDKKDE